MCEPGLCKQRCKHKKKKHFQYPGLGHSYNKLHLSLCHSPGTLCKLLPQHDLVLHVGLQVAMIQCLPCHIAELRHLFLEFAAIHNVAWIQYFSIQDVIMKPGLIHSYNCACACVIPVHTYFFLCLCLRLCLHHTCEPAFRSKCILDIWKSAVVSFQANGKHAELRLWTNIYHRDWFGEFFHYFMQKQILGFPHFHFLFFHTQPTSLHSKQVTQGEGEGNCPQVPHMPYLDRESLGDWVFSLYGHRHHICPRTDLSVAHTASLLHLCPKKKQMSVKCLWYTTTKQNTLDKDTQETVAYCTIQWH